MTAPFTGEDLVKRSLFSSLLGLKIKTPRFAHNNTAANQPCCSTSLAQNYDQPCSSRTLFQPTAEPSVNLCYLGQNVQHQQEINNYDTETTNEYNDLTNYHAGLRNRSLSDQLADNLFLSSPLALEQVHIDSHNPSPQPYPTLTSPQDIYHEIVCECEPMEKTYPLEYEQLEHEFPSNNYSFVPNYNNHTDLNLLEQHHLNQTPVIQQIQQISYVQNQPSNNQNNLSSQGFPLCQNCHHVLPSTKNTHLPTNFKESITQDQELKIQETLKQHKIGNAINIGGGGVSIEELVKIVVSAVKESGVLNSKSMSRKEHEESPETILLRKRQQNNDAAARYRKRQREAKQIAEDEMEGLLQKNSTLKREMEQLQKEIDLLKSKFKLH